MKKSVKRKCSFRGKRKSLKKIKQKGRGISKNSSQLKKKYLNRVIIFMKNQEILSKTPENLEYIKKRILNEGIGYDFIFDGSKQFQLIWNHGTKQNLEEITAGKKGIHVYVQESKENLNLLGIIHTQN